MLTTQLGWLLKNNQCNLSHFHKKKEKKIDTVISTDIEKSFKFQHIFMIKKKLLVNYKRKEIFLNW